MKKEHLYYKGHKIAPIYRKADEVYITAYYLRVFTNLGYRCILRYCRQHMELHELPTTTREGYLFSLEDIWGLCDFLLDASLDKSGRRKGLRGEKSRQLVKRLLSFKEQSTNLQDLLLSCYFIED